MKLIRTTLIAAALCVAVAGCGNDDELTDVTSQRESDTSQRSDSQAGDGLNRASGEVAELSGTTAQVQGDATQVAVTWTDATTFTAEQVGSLADLEVGACVMVASGTEAASGSAESGTDSDATQTLTAATVRVVSTDGDCTAPGGGSGAAGGGPGDGPGTGERPTELPSDLPTDLPQSGDGGQRPGGGRGQFGEVTAVGKDGFTVASTVPSTAGGTDQTAQQVEVALTDDTVISVTVTATARAVTVGSCLTATGERSSTGTLAAATVALSQKVDGACQLGFGPRRPDAADEDAA